MSAASDDFYPSTAVAIDKDKNSQQAVKWTVDHLLTGSAAVVLIHVRTAPSARGGGGGGEMDAEASELFRSFRLYCARKGRYVNSPRDCADGYYNNDQITIAQWEFISRAFNQIKVKEVLLEEPDISKALVDYIHKYSISNIVVGASNRNAITRKFRNPDVPSMLLKSVPDFCSVYVIWKGKTFTSKIAKNQPSSLPGTPRLLSLTASPHHPSFSPLEPDDSFRAGPARGPWRAPLPPSMTPPPGTPERRSFERSSEFMKMPLRDRPLSLNNGIGGDMSLRQPRLSSNSHDSFSDDLDFHGSSSYQSSDFGDLEFSSVSNDSSTGTNSPTAVNREMEAEMKRLKLELKQTMDMYSNACKEAITAKQKAKELHEWKQEEARKFEEARQAEEAALAMAEMEKARCKAAIEAAQAAQRMAELEAKRRLSAEMVAKRESEEKKKALQALAHTDTRYRKYTIEEIETATEYFAEKLKIGEGGYGPVYRASLDHTPVAIKVLRPDAAQGRKQFQQEVEVLSCIRHPNMVLLLGACPEYGCLVYEYMDYGSLEDRLFRRGNTPPIPWQIRFKIAAEIATALLFLHQTKPEPLVHRDLKPANILLDRHFVCKISDVGLARLVPPSVADTVTQYRMTSTAGTFCYIDPEYQQTGMLGVKSDIYSFGILLLQIITAKPPMALSHHVERAIERGTFREMLDSSVPNWPLDEALAFAKIALKCAELRRKDRPDLATVVLPELNRLRRLGQGSEEYAYGAGSPSISFASSGSTPSRAWSLTNEETARSNPQAGTAWKSTSDAPKLSGSSPSL